MRTKGCRMLAGVLVCVSVSSAGSWPMLQCSRHGSSHATASIRQCVSAAACCVSGGGQAQGCAVGHSVIPYSVIPYVSSYRHPSTPSRGPPPDTFAAVRNPSCASPGHGKKYDWLI